MVVVAQEASKIMNAIASPDTRDHRAGFFPVAKTSQRANFDVAERAAE
jgi:hypothetical protein